MHFSSVFRPHKWAKLIVDQGLAEWLNDEAFLKLRYYGEMGKHLDLENPTTFNEKLQWLKLYNRNPEYTRLVDKYLVRQYIADTIGPEYLIPLLGVWDDPDEIDFDKLPDRFVLKCNHNSGRGMCICKDKSRLDFRQVRKELARGLAQDYFRENREWPYKNVERKIICEEFLSDGAEELTDYKFMCFQGEMKCCFVCTDRFSDKGLHITLFDRDWQVMPVRREQPNLPEGIPCPQNYEKMVALAQQLSAGLPFLRVDFYEVAGKIYFGELTFFPAGGFEPFYPDKWDGIFGSWITLPKERSAG